MMKKICITGGIACGKSSVGGYLREFGLKVIDADEVCHDLMGRRGPLVDRIADVFGKGVLNRDGSANRRKLGRIVFADGVKRRKLNALVHPAARREISLWLEKRKAVPGMNIVAALIPLVYEACWELDWDVVICVAAPLSVQTARLVRKGFSEKEAAARVAAQMPLAEKMSRADYVIFNAGPFAGLRQQTALVLRSIQEKMEKPHGRKK